MPRPVENIPAEMEDHPVLAPGLSTRDPHTWPDELEQALRAMVAEQARGGDAA